MPKQFELEAGEHWLCHCGNSANYPFCDGSHKGTDFGPKQHTMKEKGTVLICGCKKSGDLPFCDGSHNK